MSDRALWSGFLESAARVPDRPALQVDGARVSYGELRQAALSVASTIQQRAPGNDPPLAAVLGHRSRTAFAGVLGALLSGRGYVPLNPTYPVERTRTMLERSGCAVLIVDGGSASQLGAILDGLDRDVVVIEPDASDADLEPAASWVRPTDDPDAIAYLLFTSGSTGMPKGVMVAHRNVRPFIDFMAERYCVDDHDRLSQMFEPTFDLSVFDMFVAWERGACVCCPSRKTLLKPGGFIRDSELTVWFSVPSTAVLMNRFRMLEPDSYPALRWALFCGEPLPVETAGAWSAAAPNATVENLYGPTELTLACTLYRWDSERTPSESELGVVPIGWPYPGMEALVVDEELREVPPGACGELLMRGPQMTPGYWRDVQRTASAFVVPPGCSSVYYRTGDRVRRPIDGGPLRHLGRVDFQVKINGHRVELGEVEAVVRAATGFDGVVAVGWPRTPSGCGAVEVFVEGDPVDGETLRARVAGRLPEYMRPRRYHFRDRLPLSANGKYDRTALVEWLEVGS